ncbi:hypothetical protein ACTFIR_007852 [Dictyostelium discoideum]
MGSKKSEKEIEKEKKTNLKKLHKNTLKKFLSDEPSSGNLGSGIITKESELSEKDKSKKTKKLSKKKLALLQQQQQQQQQEKQQQEKTLAQQQAALAQQISNQKASTKLSSTDYSDDDDEDYDDEDDSSDDEEFSSTSMATSIALTPKELYNSVVNKQRIKFSKSIQFTPLEQAMQFAYDDPSHIIFMVHCVDWYFQSRNLASNIEQLFSKDKNVLYYFIDQSTMEYKEKFPGDIAGVPIISIYYRQKPFKIKRDTLQYDWDEQERIKASYSLHHLKELLEHCKQAIESYHPDQNIEILIDF